MAFYRIDVAAVAVAVKVHAVVDMMAECGSGEDLEAGECLEGVRAVVE